MHTLRTSGRRRSMAVGSSHGKVVSSLAIAKRGDRLCLMQVHAGDVVVGLRGGGRGTVRLRCLDAALDLLKTSYIVLVHGFVYVCRSKNNKSADLLSTGKE